MNKKLIEQLYNSRLLRTREELEEFEESLKEISKEIQENDIPELCKVFDDQTENEDVMFGLIHLIESFSSEKAFKLTTLAISQMLENAMNWAKILIYRCLNDDSSRIMLKKAVGSADSKTKQTMKSLLNSIKIEDYDKFGLLIDEILE